jgi:hypothetical protein
MDAQKRKKMGWALLGVALMVSQLWRWLNNSGLW